MPGMATPMTPLDKVAKAMKAQQAHIHFLVSFEFREFCANKRLQSAATKNADNPISSELICPPITHIGLDAKAMAANQPARAL